MCGCGRKGHKGDNEGKRDSDSEDSIKKKPLGSEKKSCRCDKCCGDGYYCKLGFCTPIPQ